MPSRRSRSGSPSQDRSRSRSRDRTSYSLPAGVSEIFESDYFLKSDEFIVWLKEEKHKYFSELTSEKSRKYFKKFVKAWNRGKLSRELYDGVERREQPVTTAYKWTFASKGSKADAEAGKAVRAAVDAAATARPRVLGPTLPSQSDLILAKEDEAEKLAAERKYKRKRDRLDEKDRVEDMVGPKEVGREGMMEKKRAKRDNDKAFREKGDDGFVEADEKTLLGGGDSFRERIAKRDANRAKWQDKKAAERDDKLGAVQERRSAIQDRDKANMDMFMQLAKQKFG